jgi:hypothetical protein
LLGSLRSLWGEPSKMEIKMLQATIKRSSTPLYTRDLAICQKVFDQIQSSVGIIKRSEEADRIAAIIVELYRQGVQDADHLKTMVQAARGIFEKEPLQAA